MKRRVWTLLLAVLMLVAMLSGCGASSNQTAAMDMAEVEMPRAEATVEEEILYSSTTADSATGSVTTENQKLIKKVYIDAETEDMDTLLSQLTEQIQALGGYIESQEIYNGSNYSSYRYRSANMTIRIPAENLENFVGQVKGVSNVVNYNETTDDVTLTYVSTESRIAALEIEQERLLNLLSKAEKLEDLLVIEERLTEVRYELEKVNSQLRVLSNQVNYATVNLNIEQVKVYTEVEEQTVWQRISSGFSGNLRDIGEGLVNFFVWLVTYSPQLLFWAVIIAIAVAITRRSLKKRRAAKMPPNYPPQQNEEK